MPSTPKSAATRQRRNRTTTAAVLEASPAHHVELPGRRSAFECIAMVDRIKGCPLIGAWHDLEHFAKHEVEPHDFVPAEVAWHPMTLNWWRTIWDSPMIGEWVDADLPRLIEIAMMRDELWRTGDSKMAAEIRLQEREFGLTPLSRRSLQWEIKRVEAASRPAAVPEATPAQRRARMKALA